MKLKKKLLQLGVAALIGLNSLFPINVKASEPVNLENRVNNVKVEEIKRKTNYLELGTYILGGYGLTIFMHEGGHYLTGLALGAEDLEMNLIPRKDGDGVLFASVNYAGGIDKDEKIIFDLAGIGTTRMNYEILNYYLNKDKLPNSLERFSSVFALFLRLDLPRDVFFSSLNYYSKNENEYLDIHRVVENNFNEKDVPYIYAALLLAEGLDLYWDRKEIRNHFYRALGKKIPNFKENKNVNFNLDFSRDKVLVGFEYDF